MYLCDACRIRFNLLKDRCRKRYKKQEGDFLKFREKSGKEIYCNRIKDLLKARYTGQTNFRSIHKPQNDNVKFVLVIKIFH